jgi:hypothetical protein
MTKYVQQRSVASTFIIKDYIPSTSTVNMTYQFHFKRRY